MHQELFYLSTFCTNATIETKDMQLVHKDNLPAPILMKKTVSTTMRKVHGVKSLEEQCFTHISIS